MICNTCGNEMKKGFIPNYKGPVFWAPEESSIPLFIWDRPNKAVMLEYGSMWKVRKAISYYCKTCNVVVTPVPKDPTEEIE